MKSNEEVLAILVDRVANMMDDLAGKELGDTLQDVHITTLIKLLIKKGVFTHEEFEEERRLEIQRNQEVKQGINDMLSAKVDIEN